MAELTLVNDDDGVDAEDRIMIITVLRDGTGDVAVPPDLTQGQLMEALTVAHGVLDAIFRNPEPMVGA